MKTHIAAFALGLALAAAVGQMRLDGAAAHHLLEISQARQQHQDAYAEAATRARDQQKAITDKYQKGLNATLRAQTILLADAGRARTELASLRQQVAAAAHRIALPTTAPAAVAEYRNAESELFAECVGAIAELAEKADRHAADVRLMLAAWPTQTPPPN